MVCLLFKDAKHRSLVKTECVKEGEAVKRVLPGKDRLETAVALIVPFQQSRRFDRIARTQTAILRNMAHRARAFCVKR
jgi:hypothetical protein